MDKTREQTSITTYFAVFVALLVLLGLTIGAASIDLGGMSLVVSLTIAAAKTLLIIFFFMNVRRSTTAVRIFVAVGFFWLLILFSLTLADYLQRSIG